MTSTLTKQIRDQAEHANEVDVETKKLKMELERKNYNEKGPKIIRAIPKP